ncbi:unnamed protein product [Hermetia illucens]|uniref:DUF4485 domain-containing protein n=1 Tax=Hermetia illucens TaxID=343691 RepID=A0A7R8UM89_HERIL|nr:unnamed protein product [Hermetia illucens]
MASVQDVSPLDRLNREFIEAVREIMYLAIKIDSPYDRVKVMHWVRRLREQDDTKLRAAQIRNEYAQYLRIMLSGETLYFCAPFKKEPPEVLAPLPEALTNMMSEKCPDLPKTGKECEYTITFVVLKAI